MLEKITDGDCLAVLAFEGVEVWDDQGEGERGDWDVAVWFNAESRRRRRGLGLGGVVRGLKSDF